MAMRLEEDRFLLGVCYYPEQWNETMWDDDFRRMREMNFSVVRMAEFAWSIFEPEEGSFRFGLFDRAMDAAHRHGLKVILGTPTATPPAWLTAKYPEVLNVTFEGVVLQHGLRRHYNYSSPKYRELCSRITREMALHYKDHPAVIGWQIDNEFNCEISEFYSEADHLAFRSWLQEKYGSLDRLNEAWGAVFWNQTYSGWEQVHLTRPTPSPRQPNPHQLLDEKRFISDNAISFAKVQADILRELAPKQFVTTNGLFGHLDSHRMTDELLDFFSYDSYPQFSTITEREQEESPLLDRSWSLNLSAVRSISPNFCVMEQQSGPGGWVNRMDMPSPKPGQMRLWTYQSIAHGADMLLYFRWRTAVFGNEIYWHGINDYHNRPNRRVREAAQVGEELSRVGKRFLGSRFQAEIAIVRDYENEWDGEYDVWHGPFGWESGTAWFKALTRRHLPSDVLYLRETTRLDDLRRYRMLVYPHPAIMRRETAELLEQYVAEGGVVIFGCRTGYKDERGHCYMEPFPGKAAKLCGISVEEFTMVKGTRAPTFLTWNGDPGSRIPALRFNDVLAVESDTAEVMAVYASDYYAGKPAVTRNRFGAGEAWYYGAVFHEQAAARIIELLGLRSPANGWMKLPESVELAIRGSAEANGNDSDGRPGAPATAFLLNYEEKPAKLTFLRPTEELLSGQVLQGEVELEGFGVLLLRSPEDGE
ncbi:beta-galactosidase [Cohnella sp. AR92]|uniref:beta-galactosidase n=1 Tax=Cohnella sp. AR92 TaxID=648716 RepID=UPI000F8EE292|nr:beta-galactosidase [Cohnella sp. AR92]RUS48702.1 beta-galactosidase [Cohnella sp. AR92]